MVINIQLFELGNLLHHIYSKKAIKFLDIPMSSDKNIEADNDLLTLNNFLVKHLPFTVYGKIH